MGFSLDIPTKEDVKKAVEIETSVDKETSAVISDASKQKADAIMNLDLDDFADRKEITSAIETFGTDIMKKSTTKNELMKTRLGDLSRVGSEGGSVAKGLEELSVQMKDLDPSGIDFMKKGPLAKLFNPVRSYFNKFQSADNVIADIIDSLEKGARTLKADNVTLEIEQASLRDLTKQLNEKIKMGEELDTYLTNQIEIQKAQNGDPEKIKFVEEEILFPLRQRMIDFNQMLAVNQNGIIAMEVIRKNNYELIRSVNRAQTITVSALNVAVIVAGALYNQKIVLDKVQMINKTTNDMISATSKMLKEQGAEIQKQAIESNIDVKTLKDAFAESLSALESINEYKQKALPQMKEVINEFKEMTTVGEQAIMNMEKSNEMKLNFLEGKKGE
jgi:uncharacterized protein YaaN involved in tellurite resistance